MPVPVKEFEAELNRVNRVLHEFFKENDRSAAILIAAEMDSIALKILEKCLLSSAKASSPFLERNGPIEAFAVRIELLYRIGVIPPEMHHDLQIVRRIRNEFAHGPIGQTFESAEIVKCSSRLLISRHQFEMMEKIRGKAAEEKPEKISPRDFYRIGVSVLLPKLSLLQFQVEPLDPLWPRYFKAPEKPQTA